MCHCLNNGTRLNKALKISFFIVVFFFMWGGDDVRSAGNNESIESLRICALEKPVMNSNGCSVYNDNWRVASSLTSQDETRIQANSASLSNEGRSILKGNIQVYQSTRQISADTAYIYRNSRTHEITRIDLLGCVYYHEQGKSMVATRASINPNNKSGKIDNVLYQFNQTALGKTAQFQVLTAWGEAREVFRFPNEDYKLIQATYSTCAFNDKAWELRAEQIYLDKKTGRGIAHHAKLRIRNWPIFYLPYFSFPIDHQRKSGFLMPVLGYSNQGGLDMAFPYYWNISPNKDATFTPHWYTKRGLMQVGQFRYLTPQSYGAISGSFLPNDKVFKQFITDNSMAFPRLSQDSNNRFSLSLHHVTQFNPSWNGYYPS